MLPYFENSFWLTMFFLSFPFFKKIVKPSTYSWLFLIFFQVSLVLGANIQTMQVLLNLERKTLHILRYFFFFHKLFVKVYHLFSFKIAIAGLLVKDEKTIQENSRRNTHGGKINATHQRCLRLSRFVLFCLSVCVSLGPESAEIIPLGSQGAELCF